MNLSRYKYVMIIDMTVFVLYYEVTVYEGSRLYMNNEISDEENKSSEEKQLLQIFKIAIVVLSIIFITLIASFFTLNPLGNKIDYLQIKGYKPKTTDIERLFSSQKRLEDTVNKIFFHFNQECALSGHSDYAFCSQYDYSNGIINIEHRFTNLENSKTAHDFIRFINSKYPNDVLESVILLDKDDHELGKIVLYYKDLKPLDESNLYRDLHGLEYRLHKTYEFPIEKAKKLYIIDTNYYDESF